MRSRARLLVIGILVTMVALLLPGAAQASTAAVVSPGASTAHPYSAPAWWPFDTPTSQSCYFKNPGCTDHNGWVWDINASFDGNNYQKVYPLGAGIVHLGDTGQTCGHTTTRGNWMYVDHGNGILTYYGHLSVHGLVKNGQYVTARTPIGYAGNTGYSNCRVHPNYRYIFVMMKFGGTTGHYVQITHLNSCVNGQRQSWPSQLSSRNWTRFNQVPDQTTYPASPRSCIPATPQTSAHPTSVRLARYNSTSVRATWAAPAASSHVSSLVSVLQEYHPSIHRWLDLRRHTKAGSSRSTIFTVLDRHRQYRVNASFGNTSGWSAPSAWAGYTLP